MNIGDTVRTGAGYEATVVAIDGEMVQVEYDGYPHETLWVTARSLR